MTGEVLHSGFPQPKSGRSLVALINSYGSGVVVAAVERSEAAFGGVAVARVYEPCLRS